MEMGSPLYLPSVHAAAAAAVSSKGERVPAEAEAQSFSAKGKTSKRLLFCSLQRHGGVLEMWFITP